MEKYCKLSDAINKVTLDFNGLKHGEEVELNEEYTLYYYIQDDVVVIVRTEDWEHILQVMTDGDKLVFEDLVGDVPEEIVGDGPTFTEAEDDEDEDAIKNILKDISSRTDNKFLKKLVLDWVEEKSVGISSNYNYDIKIILNRNRKGGKVVHEIKEWEYKLSDIEEIIGFENTLVLFKEIQDRIIKLKK